MNSRKRQLSESIRTPSTRDFWNFPLISMITFSEERLQQPIASDFYCAAIYKPGWGSHRM